MNRQKRKIRMVGMDLDGTLFNNEKIITDHTKKILTKAIEQGVTVLAATGRPQSGLPSELLKVPGIRYALTANGARIVELSSGRVIYEQLIPWETSLKVIRRMQTWEHCAWEVYIDGKVYVEEGEYRFLYHKDMSPALIEYMHRSRIFRKNLLKQIEQEQIGLEKIHMVFEDTEASKKVAEFIKAEVETTLQGMTIELKQQPKKARLQLMQDRDFEIGLHRWGPDYADPMTYLDMWLTGASYNYQGWSNAEYDALIESASKGELTKDLEARWEALKQAEAIALNEAALMPVYQTGSAVMIRKGVTGFEFHSVGVPTIYRSLNVTE